MPIDVDRAQPWKERQLAVREVVKCPPSHAGPGPAFGKEAGCSVGRRAMSSCLKDPSAVVSTPRCVRAQADVEVTRLALKEGVDAADQRNQFVPLAARLCSAFSLPSSLSLLMRSNQAN